jgi:hypothetical protein
MDEQCLAHEIPGAVEAWKSNDVTVRLYWKHQSAYIGPPLAEFLRMRRVALLGLVGLGMVVGCAGAEEDDVGQGEDMLVSSSPRPFDVTAMAPRAKGTFVAPSGARELCIIAGRVSDDGYTVKDAKKEAKLCRVDFNADPATADVIAAGLAPKANSTNPATDVHEVTAEIPRDVVESFEQANARDRKADKIGRLKSSLNAGQYERTSSYSPSIVGYYGTSRMLGNIGEVTPAVWRTLDIKRHAKVADNGKRLTVAGSQIVKTLWATFLSVDNSNGAKEALTYTSDGGQVYGAFIPSVSGDEKDKDIDTLDKLKSSPRFKRLIDGRPIASTVATDLKTAVESIVPMQGVVEMLVLDAFMLQGDRLSGDNVSYVPFVYFQKPDGSVDKMSKKDFDELREENPTAAPAGAVPVRKLYLNDVDAGLVARNADSFQNGSEYALLKQVSHVSADLYARVRQLGARTTDPAFETFAKTEWRYTDRDWARYQAMAQAVSTLFHDRCAAGSLVLDLDVAKHVSRTNLAARQGCD